jgi:hypothetical protein
MSTAGRARAAQLLPGLMLSAVGIVLAVRGVEWQKFTSVIARGQPLLLLSAAAASGAAVIAAGMRWRIAARPHADLSAGDAIDIVMICNLVNMMLARLGDLARAGLTAHVSGTHSGRVLGGVVVERFVDVFMLLALAAGMSQVVPFPAAVRTGVFLFALVAVAALVTIWWAAGWFAGVARAVIGVFSTRAASVVAGLIEALAEGVRTSARSDQLWRVGAWSFGVWALSGIAIILTIRALGIDVPWFAALFVLLVINLGGAIPASPGAIGVYHYLFVLALSVWIPEPSAALGAAVVSHAIGVIVTVLLGVAGLARQDISVGRLRSIFRPVVLAPTK